MISLLVQNNTTEIVGLTETELAELATYLRYKVESFFFARRGGWDGYTYLLKKNRFPTGLFRRVVDLLKTIQPTHEIEVRDLRYPLQKGPLIPLSITGRDYQVDAKNVALEYPRCVLQMPTGSGKTPTIAMILAETNVPTLILTHRILLLDYLSAEISSFIGQPVGKIGDGLFDIQRVTVGSIFTVAEKIKNAVGFDKDADLLKRYVTEQVECLIVDEAHHSSSSKQMQFVINRASRAYSRIGLSATPWKNANEDLWLEGLIGPMRYRLTASELIRRGFLSKPYIFFLNYGKQSIDAICPKCDAQATRAHRTANCPECGKKAQTIPFSYPIQTAEVMPDFECPNQRCEHKWAHAERGIVKQTHIMCDVMSCKHTWTPFQNTKRVGVVTNVVRNRLIAKLASDRIKRNRSVLISVEQINHGKAILAEVLKTIAPSQVVFIQASTPDKFGILKAFEEKKILCVIATSVLGEGVNIPSLDVLINAKGDEGAIGLIQIVGRVLRRTKTKRKVTVFDFNDKFAYFNKKSHIRREILKLEPEFKVIEMTPKWLL